MRGNEVIVNIGYSKIKVTDGHIYCSEDLPRTYDYMPWDIIGVTLKESTLSNLTLIDIGANVGDSVAHFRRHSDADVICIEPSELFYSFLKENIKNNFINVKAIQALFSPDDLIGKIALLSGSQTGTTNLADTGNAWTGEYITFRDLIFDDQKNYIVKTDTDGFDKEILQSLLELIDSKKFNIPIILDRKSVV